MQDMVGTPFAYPWRFKAWSKLWWNSSSEPAWPGTNLAIRSPGRVNVLHDSKNGEIVYNFWDAQIEWVEDCTPLSRPLRTLSNVMIGRFLRCKVVVASLWDFVRFILVQVDWLGEFVLPYPRKVGLRCVSPLSPNVMYRPLSYYHVPNNLEQGRINVIGSSFSKSVSVFITQIAGICWDSSYEYLVVLSQFVT